MGIVMGIKSRGGPRYTVDWRKQRQLFTVQPPQVIYIGVTDTPKETEVQSI